jgi:hypothetical protein
MCANTTSHQQKDMYRIQSFHSPKAPPLESDVMQHFARGAILFGGDDEDDSPLPTQPNHGRQESDGSQAAEENFDYDNPNILVVVVNDERIVLDDVTKAVLCPPFEQNYTHVLKLIS